MANTNTRPYEAHKITTRTLTNQLVDFYGYPFNELMYPDGEMTGVLAFGPPGIGKTRSSMAAAEKIAKENGYELVMYTPGVKPVAGKKQMLFVHMTMAGMTSGSMAGFPTTAINKDATNEEKIEYVSRQVIPTIWRTAREFPAAVYLMDEITHVISQEAMLSLLSEGIYQETRLSQRALIIATANEGIADGTMQQKLNLAFRNRFALHYIKADVKEWREDYANAHVHPACLALSSLFSSKFQTLSVPGDNLLNAPTLRSLTKLSEDLTYMEAKKFRARTEQDQIDPKGAWTDDEKAFSANLEAGLFTAAYARFGDESLAQSFCQLYSLAFKTVMPEVKKIINGKMDTLTPSFVSALKMNGDAADKVAKNGINVGTTDDQLKAAMDSSARAFTFVDYLPRMFLEAWSNLPKHPVIVAQLQTCKTDAEKVEKLHAFSQGMIERFLQGVMLLPSNMQMMCIQHFKELSSLPEFAEASRHYETAGKSQTNVPMGSLLQVLSAKSEVPEYKAIYETMHKSRTATETIVSLGV